MHNIFSKDSLVYYCQLKIRPENTEHTNVEWMQKFSLSSNCSIYMSKAYADMHMCICAFYLPNHTKIWSFQYAFGLMPKFNSQVFHFKFVRHWSFSYTESHSIRVLRLQTQIAIVASFSFCFALAIFKVWWFLFLFVCHCSLLIAVDSKFKSIFSDSISDMLLCRYSYWNTW